MFYPVIFRAIMEKSKTHFYCHVYIKNTTMCLCRVFNEHVLRICFLNKVTTSIHNGINISMHNCNFKNKAVSA